MLDVRDRGRDRAPRAGGHVFRTRGHRHRHRAAASVQPACASPGSTSRRRCASAPHTRTFLNCHGIGLVEVLREQPLAIVQRRPVGVCAGHRCRDTACRSRDCAGSRSRRARRARRSDSPSPRPFPTRHDTVTCRLVALLCGASLRASSIDSCEPYQYAFFLWPASSTPSSSMPVMISSMQDALAILQVPVAAGELVHRNHRRIAGVIGVVHRRAVHDLGALRAPSGSRRSRSPRRA